MTRISSLFVLISFVIFGFSFWKNTEASPEKSYALADTAKKDPQTGLILDPHYDLVIAHCTACHEAKVVTNFKATREGWLDKIRTMQKSHNMWQLGEAEPKILDYLAKNYAPKQAPPRRNPLKDVQWYKLDQ